MNVKTVKLEHTGSSYFPPLHCFLCDSQFFKSNDFEVQKDKH